MDKEYTEDLNWNGKYTDIEYPEFAQLKQNDDSIWLTIPTFRSGTGKDFQKALNMLQENSNPSYVVFDLRGNGGGSTEYAFPLIEAVYGTGYLKSLGNSISLNQKSIFSYKATQGNLEFYKSTLKVNKTLKSAMEPIINGMEKALKSGKKLYTIIDNPFYNYKGMKGMSKPYPPVFFVTDTSIGSSSWQFVRVLKALSGTYQIGDRTDTEQHPTEMARYPIGKNYVLYNPSAWIIAPSGYLGKAFMPEIPFTKGLYNTNKLKKHIKYYYGLIKD